MTYEEYVTNIAQPFRTILANGEDWEEPVMCTCIVTCHTEGCDNTPRNNVHVMERADGTYRVRCSPCGQLITDVVPWGYQGVAFDV